MKTVFISAVGSDIGQATCRIIRSIRPNWKIIGTDIHPHHAGRALVDEFHLVPPAVTSDYWSVMEEDLSSSRADFWLPLSEAEMRIILSKGKSHLGQTALIGVQLNVLRTGLDKYETANFLSQIEIPSPWTILAEADALPQSLPCIFKPRRSAGSKGVFVCTSLDQCHFCSRTWSDGIFQEQLLPDDSEVTCAVYRDLNGDVAVLQMLRRLSAGATDWVRVIDHPEIASQCKKIAVALNLHGPINVQLRMTTKGPRIFEINPRLSSTVMVRHKLGFSDLEWMINEAEGIPIKFFSPMPGIEMARVSNFVSLESES